MTLKTDYKDYYAKVVANESKTEDELNNDTCAKFLVVGNCDNCGSKTVKVLYCGKEWCPVCGAKWSAVHQRRFARMLPKVSLMNSIGYFVIEWPVAHRSLQQMRSKVIKDSNNNLIAGWRVCTNKVLEVLAGKRSGHSRDRKGGFFPRGIIRWHWFGNVEKATEYSIHSDIAKTTKWNPHINVMVDGEYIPPGKLELIKKKLRKALACSDLIVNYEYTKSPAEAVHVVQYFTRATFLDETWDEEMAYEIYNFRSIRYWGKWEGEACWGVKDNEFIAISQLEKGQCDDCGGHVIWTEPLDSKYLHIWQKAGCLLALGAGYYKLKHAEYNDG